MPLDDDADVVTLDNSDEEIAASWKAIQERNAEEEPAPAEAKTEAPAEEVKEKTAPQRARDETGKFAKEDLKEGGDQESTKQAVLDENSKQAADLKQDLKVDEGGDQQDQRDLNRPPSSWKPAAKAKWDALDPDVRAEIARREGDFLKGQHELLPDAQFGRNMRSVVDPYRMLIESEGATPEVAVRDLLRTAAILRVGTPQQKTAAMMQVIQQYGVQMPGPIAQDQQGQDWQGQQAQQPQQFHDPRVDQMLAQQEQARIAQEQAQSQSILQEIEAFRNTTDASGKLKYPFYENVFNDIVATAGMVRSANPTFTNQQVLQEAYDRAVWANPETRQLVSQQKLNELEAQRREENLRKASEAKKAASVNVPRRAGQPTQAAIPQFGTPEADALMLETWKAING